MSLDILVWVILFTLLLLGVPVFAALGTATLVALMMSGIPLSIIPLDLYKVSEMFPLVAVPAFILAGSIMERGGMAKQIVDVAAIFVGRMRGGYGIVTIIGCMFFAAMIGSGPGTVAAMGTLMIPSMVREGYSKDYAAGVCCTGGTLGILIPPSNPMIVYGVIANVSISGMFIAGLVPGFLVSFALMITAYIIARKKGFKGSDKVYTPKEVLSIIKNSFWALMAPVVILGGIYSGIFTPVEASIIAVAYSLIVGTLINRQISLKGLIDCFRMTNSATGTVLIVVGVSMLFGRFLTMTQVPQRLASWVMSISTDPITVLLMIVVFLFFLGMFMETLATIVIVTPVVLPLLMELGINPIHFGIIFVMTNELALLSPPLGVNLFVAMGISGLSLERVAKASIPYMVALMICTIIVVRFPEIALYLPRMFGFGQ